MEQKEKKPSGKMWLLLMIFLNGEIQSTMELVKRLKMTRPGSAIHYLRKRFKIPIVTEIVWQVGEDGKKVRYAKYQISYPMLSEQRVRFGC